MTNLLESLRQLNYSSEDDNPKQNLTVAMYGKVLPFCDPQLEEAIGKLKFKFRVDKEANIPTLQIYSAKAFTKEDIEFISTALYDAVPEIGSLYWDEDFPFMIKETHTYCVDLLEHCDAIYSVIHQRIYGTYATIPDEQR